MEVSWVLLVKLSFASIWITSHAQRDMSVLSQYLPRDTFIIGNTASTSTNAFINPPPPPSSFIPHRRAGLIQRIRDSSQDPAFHRPVPSPQNFPLPGNPLRQQQTREQIRSTASRFGSGSQVPQLPAVAPNANVPQTPFIQADSGSPSLAQQAIPQKSSVPNTPFIPSGHDHSSSGNHPVNIGSNPQRPSQPPRAQVQTGTFVPSAFPQNIPVNQQRPMGQLPRRHPMCGIFPPTGECRAAFPRYYYNPQTDQCDCFLYGGCGAGLQYSYSTLRECIETCLPRKTEEGPVCAEIFRDEDVFYDSPAEKPISVNQIVPKQNADHLSDDDILFILVNPVSPQELAARESNRLRQKNRVGGTIPG